MARDSWLKRLIWLRGSPAGGSGASYEKTVGPAPIISISDAKAKPAKSLIVGMEPIQAGSGDPSPDNIRPITGRTGVTVERTAKNIFDETPLKSIGTYPNNIGGGYYATDIYRMFSGTYTATFLGSVSKNLHYRIYIVKADGTQVGKDLVDGTTLKPQTITIEDGGGIVLAVAGGKSQSYLDDVFANTHFMLVCGNTAPMAYEPYVGASYPVTWQSEAGTVYGCTVDPVTGEGNIDWVGLTLDGVNKVLNVASTTYIGATTTRGYINNSPYTSKAGVSSMEAWSMCSAAKFIVSTADNGVQAYYIGLNGTEINLRILNSLTGVTSEDTAAQARTKINAYLAENPITVVYAVKDPIPFTLTPQQIQLLKGSNTLWSDADDLTLTYLGTTPANLLGGMLGGGLGGGYNLPAEQDPDELTEPEATETDEPAEETPAEEGENNGE